MNDIKLNVNTKELTAALKLLAAGTNGKRKTMPILDNVLLEAENDSLVLTVHNMDDPDLQTCLSTTIGAPGLDSGKITAHLRDLVKALPSPRKAETVTLTWEDNRPLLVEYGSTHAKVDTMPADEFPAPLDCPAYDDPAWSWFYELKNFRRAVAEVEKALSTDGARPLLCCMHGNKAGYLEATDGYRMHRAEYSRIAEGALLPYTLVKPLLRSTAATSATCAYSEGDTTTTCYQDDSGLRIVAKVNATNYPDLDVFIPRRYQSVIKVKESDVWVEHTKAAARAVKGKYVYGVRLTLEENKVLLAAPEGVYACELPAEAISLSPSKDNTVIGINPNYLSDVINAAAMSVYDEKRSWPKLTLEFNIPTTPVVIKNGNGFTGVVMPVLINDIDWN